MKIYLAAPWADRTMMTKVAEAFEGAGHQITWKWWDTPDLREGQDSDLQLQEQAFNDATGVLSAQVLVVLNTSKSEGKAVEQGLAIGRGMPIIAIGKRGVVSKNVFHYLPAYRWVENVQEALEVLDVLEWVVTSASRPE